MVVNCYKIQKQKERIEKKRKAKRKSRRSSLQNSSGVSLEDSAIISRFTEGGSRFGTKQPSRWQSQRRVAANGGTPRQPAFDKFLVQAALTFTPVHKAPQTTHLHLLGGGRSDFSTLVFSHYFTTSIYYFILFLKFTVSCLYCASMWVAYACFRIKNERRKMDASHALLTWWVGPTHYHAAPHTYGPRPLPSLFELN